MRLLYKPFAIVAGILGTILGKRAFQALWGRIDSSPSPPPPRTGEASLFQVAGGAALQGATMAAIAATVDRLMARAFHHLFGVWPEQSKAEEVSQHEAEAVSSASSNGASTPRAAAG